MSWLVAIAAIIALSVSGHAGEFRATLECHGARAPVFLLYRCEGAQECRAAASDYMREEKGEGNYLCHGVHWEVNVY